MATTAGTRRWRVTRASTPSLAALVLVTGVGPFATDTYLAALPDVQRSLSTSAAVAQLTVTAFIVGNALGQLVLGPVSDGRGRRGLLLGGAAAFCLTSVVSALAPTGFVLVTARLVQGVAAGGGVAIGRAVIGDTAHGDDAARRFSTLAAINFLAPVVAPAVGGAILTAGTWRTVFLVLAGLGAVMLAGVFVGVPETRERSGVPGDTGLRANGRRMADLARDRAFMRIVVVQCLTYAGFFTYIGGSAFVLETVYGLSATAFAAVFAVNALAMAVVSALVRALVGRAPVRRLRDLGIAISTTAALVLGVSAVLASPGAPPLPLVWVALTAVVGGMGFTIPTSIALAQEVGRRAPGTASALQGGLAFLVGAAVTPLTGVLGYSSVRPMALLMAGFFVCAVLTLLLSGRSPRG